MKSDWAALRVAVKRAKNLKIWWRDDDATAPSPALDHLLNLSDRLDLLVNLAVIPADATTSLARAIDGSSAIPVVHGWKHTNHQTSGKKAEFYSERAGIEDELSCGLDRMKRLFPHNLQSMFVPPWNRIGNEVITQLSPLGYGMLSTFGARPTPEREGLQIVNTHIDPIDWRGSRNLVDIDKLQAHAIDLLTQRKDGRADPNEPLGLLTHHLVHSPAIWAFTERFLTEALEAGATPARLTAPIASAD